MNKRADTLATSFLAEYEVYSPNIPEQGMLITKHIQALNDAGGERIPISVGLVDAVRKQVSARIIQGLLDVCDEVEDDMGNTAGGDGDYLKLLNKFSTAIFDAKELLGKNVKPAPTGT